MWVAAALGACAGSGNEPNRAAAATTAIPAVATRRPRLNSFIATLPLVRTGLNFIRQRIIGCAAPNSSGVFGARLRLRQGAANGPASDVRITWQHAHTNVGSKGTH